MYTWTCIYSEATVCMQYTCIHRGTSQVVCCRWPNISKQVCLYNEWHSGKLHNLVMHYTPSNTIIIYTHPLQSHKDSAVDGNRGNLLNNPCFIFREEEREGGGR